MPANMKPIDHLTDDEFAHLVQRAVALPDVPPALQRAAIDLWPGLQPTTMKNVAQATLRFIAATLSFDSWAGPSVAFGMRSASSDTRHLLFSAAGRDIDLRISPAAGHFALTGQILGPDEAGVIELTQPNVTAPVFDARVAQLDTMGEFRLDNVPGGTYQMTLRMGGDEIVLPPIEVGARPG
jgi:hypothetical protein